MQYILASESPRRITGIRQLIPTCEVMPAHIDEQVFASLPPLASARACALAKARTISAIHPNSVVIGADTIVVFKQRIFGKPCDYTEAKRMLATLSGRTHRVVTAVAVCRARLFCVDAAVTRVTFRVLSGRMIEAYLAHHEYLDKAGGYAIQESGRELVLRIDGEYDTVVGLPLRLVTAQLQKLDLLLHE